MVVKKQKPPKDMIMVGSKTREVIKSSGCNMASDFVDALSDKSHSLIADAVERAKANGRKTVRATDL